MRAENAVDFWRGVALVMIFINHVPGNVFSYYTLRNYAISDAAELFVFLAGWSLSFVAGAPDKRVSVTGLWFRLWSRAFVIYQAQLCISLIALAILAIAAISRSNPLFLEWLNSGAAFYDPPRAYIGLALLTYQLSYFNILPLYVALLLLAPPMIGLALWSKRGALAASFTLYVVALATGLRLPSWPSEDQWYFNPLCWQVLLVLGFVAAELRTNTKCLEVVRRSVPFAIAVLIAGAAATLLQFHPDPASVPRPRAFFLFDKTFLSPARLISLIALIVAFHGVFSYIMEWVRYFPGFLCSLGRNSLPVFCVASLLALVGQILRFIIDGGLKIDIAIVVSGLVMMGLTAWFAEGRSRHSGARR